MIWCNLGERGMFALGRPIALRPDYDAARRPRQPRDSKDADQVRRLLSLALVYDGGGRTEAAQAWRCEAASGAAVQCERAWGRLIDRKAPRLQG